MILLVDGATATVARHAASGRLGHLLSPAGRQADSVRATGLRFGVDNGAYSGWVEAAFLALLSRWEGLPGCLFVACPDAVADARRTLALWPRWAPEVRRRGFPAAFVLQDGQEHLPLPDADAFFVGGSTRWKLSRHAAGLCGRVKARGAWLHVGRVNTRRRFAVAAELGADSVDGSGFSKWPDTRIPMALRWLAGLERQPTLF